MKPQWRVRAERRIHDHLYQIDEHDITTSDGRQFTMPIIDGPDGVIICPLLADGRVVLVRQWRHGLGRYTLELPAGHIDPGKNAEQAARQELAEEADLGSDHWSPLGSWQALGTTKPYSHGFLAEQCYPVLSDHLDDAEPIILDWKTALAATEGSPADMPAQIAVVLLQAARRLGH